MPPSPENMSFDSDHINILIDSQNKSIIILATFSASIAFIGITIIFLPHLFDIQFDSTILNIGGVLATSLSAFPIREILKRKQNKDILRIYSSQLEKIKRGEMSIQILDSIENRVWKIIDMSYKN